MTFVKTALFHKAGEGSGGGGDQHNLGFYADLTALQTAHPTGLDGDFAILGSTDTVWVWDSGTSAWKDTDTKGQVTSVNGQTGDVTIPNELPSQTGNSGKFLTTDGTDVSWGDALVNSATGTNSLSIGSASTDARATSIGKGSSCFSADSVAVGASTSSGGYDTVIGSRASATGWNAISIGCLAKTTANYAIQIGYDVTNSDANTLKVGNQNGNFEIMSADGTIPADRLPKAINKYSTMPTAASTNEGWIVQYTGTTDANYTHGYVYECVSDGQNPATYSWVQTNVQPAPSGLPSQTGNSGKFLTTDGTDASWATVNALQNTATGTDSLSILGSATSYTKSVNIGISSSVYGDECVSLGCKASCKNKSVAVGYWSYTDAFGAVACGNSATARGEGSIAIGVNAFVEPNTTRAIQLGSTGSITRNSDANTFKVANTNGNFEIMSADGTIPHARLTNAVVSNSITIAAADWNGGTTVSKTISGLTATSIVWVAPDSASQSDYLNAGVYASSQTTDTLDFSCTTTPTSALVINVIYC